MFRMLEKAHSVSIGKMVRKFTTAKFCTNYYLSQESGPVTDVTLPSIMA